MPRGRDFSLTDRTTLGLFFIQRYRFLTIDQFARSADLNRSTASDQLLNLARHGLLRHFGNTGLAGHGKTPKVYFLTRKGWEILVRESDIPPEIIGRYKEIHVESRWSPQMYHRLRTVDMMIAAEVAVRARPQLSVVATFMEYRRVKRGNQVMRETTDYVAEEEISENRLVPDGLHPASLRKYTVTEAILARSRPVSSWFDRGAPTWRAIMECKPICTPCS